MQHRRHLASLWWRITLTLCSVIKFSSPSTNTYWQETIQMHGVRMWTKSRSHQPDIHSQPTCNSQEQLYSQSPPNLLPPASNFPHPQQAFPPSQIVGHDFKFYPPQTQPTVHSIPISAEQAVVVSEVNYANSGLVYAPQPHYDVPATTAESVPRYSPVPQRVIPEYKPQPPIVYHENIPMEKPIVSRMFNPYQDPRSWDFLGLEG
ncbi:hypothetical protein AJ79_01998 [Helicocarpus griseus UAMH5409]|uniref:Uncharacterized protein n=1 Tax=Helicocarpus griseus UAMH5409 TaxID=1447875 RepID=A0A2B7Y549_9EURO|nr:hypothetical protein AJ79_01998 [Helicocarpus griseus UAMH5409]